MQGIHAYGSFSSEIKRQNIIVICTQKLPATSFFPLGQSPECVIYSSLGQQLSAFITDESQLEKILY